MIREIKVINTDIVEITSEFSEDVDTMENALYGLHPEIEKSGIINIRLGDDRQYHVL